MKNVLTAATISAIALIATPLAAQNVQVGEPIVVSSNMTLDQWAEIVSQDLAEQLDRMSTLPLRDQPNGVVQVRFTCDEDGKPANIAVYRSSGEHGIERLGKRAVKRLKALHPMPEVAKNGQPFLANIVFADSYEQERELFAKLADMETERLASNGEARTYIALK
ncbi:TonB family protein [Altererythrobacter aurantiacus]|uniref:TonB family protein n=1 Tax=Parapontixanthobacter aurantiacus TaxID=1463599 RepID=A0A844ZI27_9SPHN|nr:TonB family protein [Parapontixanthobacter aurantiacus]MXO86640.1 TonB family protein [Parapontixanthobacter aurantiacus]